MSRCPIDDLAPEADLELTITGVLADGGWRPGAVAVQGGRIAAIAFGSDVDALLRRARRRIDVGGALLLPGVVDAHVHCLSHAGEGIDAATSAAAAGGVTTIIEMPFDSSGPIDSSQRLSEKQDMADRQARVDIALLATLRPSGGWRQAEELANLGAVGFKVSLFDTDPIRFPRTSDAELVNVMAPVRDTRRTLSVHAENNEVVQAAIQAEALAHPTDVHAHARSRPAVAETLGVLTVAEIAATTGVALHICHLSLPRSVDLAHRYIHQGADISIETCPHYLTFSDADVTAMGTRLKINPPLRDSASRLGLWSRIADRSIAVISSDHAPWPLAMKEQAATFANHSGVPGVETLAATVLGQAWARDPGGASFMSAVRALSENPAKRFGLGDRKGRLEVGFDADLIVFEPDAQLAEESGRWRFDESLMHSNCGWSPYHDFAPGGRVIMTISRGDVVWSADGGLMAGVGRGELLTPGDTT